MKKRVIIIAVVLLCVSIAGVLATRFGNKKKSPIPSASPTVTTLPTPGHAGNVDTEILWNLYSEYFPADSLKKEHSENNESSFAARLEVTEEEWKEAQAKLKSDEWIVEKWKEPGDPVQFRTMDLLISKELFTEEERKNWTDTWFGIHQVDLPEKGTVDETVYLMQGKDDGIVLILYVVTVH